MKSLVLTLVIFATAGLAARAEAVDFEESGIACVSHALGKISPERYEKELVAQFGDDQIIKEAETIKFDWKKAVRRFYDGNYMPQNTVCIVSDDRHFLVLTPSRLMVERKFF